MNYFTALVVACFIASVAAECPSACSGHGTCGAYDACSCFRNWMSNDCSERVCPFGLAHVDTPLGDLDSSSGKLTGPGTTVIVNDEMYPSGTQEQFPRMMDSANNVLTNSAHYYRECSNKGICDRSSGECECFEGYDGSSCQRASCPSSGNGVCSGHGTCKSIQELAAGEHENIYRLWDEDITMGCDCDAGYEGADCASRTCKVGMDPLYYDDFANVRYANYTVQFYIQDQTAEIYGNYSLIFTDVYGEDWQTEPIDINANCATIQDRLESIPNDVIPYGSVKCYKSEESLHYEADLDSSNIGQKATEADGTGGTSGQFTSESTTVGEPIYSGVSFAIVNKFILAFPGNPGEIAPLKVNRYLDGKRATLFSTETALQTIGVHVYANGFHGETTDYVNDECEGVLVSLGSSGVTDTGNGGTSVDNKEKLSHHLVFNSNLEFERLKRCLGDSDGVTTNNIEVYDWDYGNFMNPHLIKLVDATQDRFTEYVRADGSSYKVISSNEHQYHTPLHDVGDNWEHVPMTKLCNRGSGWVYDNYRTNPIHKLLDNDDKDDSTTTGGAPYNRGTHGWCRNLDPAGFFAIIYFDDCTAEGISMVTTYLHSGSAANDDKEACDTGKSGFRVLTRPATDYATDTKFHVYTTKGTLQQVSQHSGAYTQNYKEKWVFAEAAGSNNPTTLNPDFVHSFHSNVIHVANTTAEGAQGQIDCETAWDFTTGLGRYNNFDCLNKGDKIFLLNLGTRDDSNCESSRSYKNIAGQTVGTGDSCFYKSTALSFDSNPHYINMYTVEKIGKIPKDINKADYDRSYVDTAAATITNAPDAIHFEGYRHQITLNMGVNTQYLGHDSETDASPEDANGDSAPDNKATIYKFHPPALNSTGTTGYEYVGACSNRGICNGDDGLCECFEGYTGDSCQIINSLAQ